MAFNLFRRKSPSQIATLGEEKSSQGGSVLTSGKKHEYALSSWKSFAQEGYKINPTVFRCINFTAKSFGRVPLYAFNDKGEKMPDSVLQRILDKPNPDESGVEFRSAASAWFNLTGNTFTEVKGSKIVTSAMEVWNWQPYQMSIQWNGGDSYLPTAYWFNEKGQGRRSWIVDRAGQSDMLHWRDFNPDPNCAGMGMSPLQAASRAADTHNAATDWRYQQQRNGGTLNGILSFLGVSATPKQKEQFDRDLRQKFQGAHNSSASLATSNAEVKFTSLSQTLKDAEWLSGTKLNKQEICEAFGIPGQLVGIEGSLTFANYAEARQAFYEEKIIPELDLYCSELNRWLVPKIEGEEGLKVGYSLEDITALELRRKERRQQKIDSGAYSINEIRRAFGDEEVDDPEADVIMVDPNKLPLGMSAFSDDEAQEKAAVRSLMSLGLSFEEAEQKAFELSTRMG